MSAFRPIRPSTDTKDEPLSGESSLQGALDSHGPLGKGRKRRVPSHVSQNACTNCKKARAKCDGEEPAPCTRCISRDQADQCVYEVHVKTAKEELVRKVKDLEERYSLLKLSVEEKDRWIDRVLQLLNDENAPGLLDKINSGHLDHQLLHILRRPPISRFESSDSIHSARRLSDVAMDPPGDVEMNEKIKSVAHDETLANHLMALYFTWVHPVHMFFSERRFTSSLRANDSTYCNAAMINAMCAVGCCYLADEDGTESDPKRLGQRYYQQAWAEIQTEEKMTLLSTVTYAILFLFELNQGHARNASSHLRLAVESLRAVDRREWTDEAFQISLWGIQTLNTAWAAFTYQKPAAPISPRALVFIGVELDSPDAFWQPYKHPEDDTEFERPSYAIETAKEFTKLNQIIHETINVYCGSRGRVSARGILQLYRRFLEWRELLPAHLASTSMFDGALPHVFALHIHFAVAVCQLFAPLLSILDSPSRERILGITIQNAKDGLDIYQRYRALYSNRLQPTLLSFCLVHLADVMVRYSEQHPDESLAIFCLETLSEANGGFAYIGALQAMFCETVVDSGMALPPRERVLEMMGGRNRHSFSREEKLDCCERLTYAQPVDLLVERLDPHLADEFDQEWRSFSRHSFGGASDPSTSASSDQTATENPPSRGLRIQRLVNP